ncbi:hypothetical protein [Pseudochryseolinea flava]|uniref:hypothetical protein n=1 Tax=Pseudochryseolinea flava TaxID=2059302 RepID=UPI001402DB9A|nr:hypothetical protein [Pseudochryseolinea flava]
MVSESLLERSDDIEYRVAQGGEVEVSSKKSGDRSQESGDRSQESKGRSQKSILNS